MAGDITSSIIICTRNRSEEINKLLISITKQSVQPTELIVIDSSDQSLIANIDFVHTFDASYFAQTKLVYKHTKPGLTYQRNVGISFASSDIIYFLDDDVLLADDYLEQMNRVFVNNPSYAGGMSAIANMYPKRYDLFRFIRIFFLLQRDYASGYFTLSGMPTHPYGTSKFTLVEVLNGCGVYRASVCKKHQFDEQLKGYAYMEDCDFSRRVSYEHLLFYNPAAKLFHYNSPVSRDNVKDNRAMYIHNYSYLFFKNVYPRNRAKLLAYCWSVLGLFFEAILLRNKDYICGYMKGLKHFYTYNFCKRQL